MAPRHPKVVRIHRRYTDTPGTRITFVKPAGWADVHDTAAVAFDDGVVPGMVVAKKAHGLSWFWQRESSEYLVQVGPESEDGHTICTCRPTVEDSSPNPLCGAIHADMVDLDDVELYFHGGEDE